MGRSQPLTQTIRPYQGSGRLSPDGAYLAVTISGANHSIWLYDIARVALTRLAAGFDQISPDWTPDGSHVSFVSTRDGVGAVYWQAADGSRPAELLTAGEYWRSPGGWSPDGSVLAFRESHPDTGSDLWLLTLDTDGGPEPFLITPAWEGSAQFSPDGHFIAYGSDESGVFEIYVRSYLGDVIKRQVSNGGGRSPRWSRDGTGLFYRNGLESMAVDVDTRDGLALGRPRTLFEKEGERFDVAPDGQRFVTNERVESEPPPSELILVKHWVEELERLVPTEN